MKFEENWKYFGIWELFQFLVIFRFSFYVGYILKYVYRIFKLYKNNNYDIKIIDTIANESRKIPSGSPRSIRNRRCGRTKIMVLERWSWKKEKFFPWTSSPSSFFRRELPFSVYRNEKEMEWNEKIFRKKKKLTKYWNLLFHPSLINSMLYRFVILFHDN